MSITASGSTNVSYPLYDCHGNMVSTLTKAGSGSYSYSSVRLFDAWGNVRSANTSGDPKGRYCANLGHKQDDESGLVYMRARYYEPGSGRFVSEDRQKQGLNWFEYTGNQPENSIDRSGMSPAAIAQAVEIAAAFALFKDVMQFLVEGCFDPSLVTPENIMNAFVCDFIIGAGISGIATGMGQKLIEGESLDNLLMCGTTGSFLSGAGVGIWMGMAVGKRIGDVFAELCYIDNCT